MALTNLIDNLKQFLKSKNPPSGLKGIFDGAITFPEDFKDAEVEFKDLNYGFKGKPELYHLLISAFPKRTLENTQPILEEFFIKSKDLRLGKGVADANYRVFWTPEAFQDEKRLTGLFSSGGIEVESSVYTCDPTEVMGMPLQRHDIRASVEANKMTIKASGKYQEQLAGLIECVNPQYVKLNLSKEDAGRLLRSVNRNSGKKSLVKKLEKILEPQRRAGIRISSGGWMTYEMQEMIEFTVAKKFIAQFEEAIGKPLISASPNQESQAIELIKIYGLGGLIRGERLSDLKALARDIPQIDLGIIYNHPVLTTSEAKELLDAKIDIVSKCYEPLLGFGSLSHARLIGVVKRLAREHFGEEILDKFEESNVNDYVNFLKARGYIEPLTKGDECKKVPASSGESEHIDKERHLLEFFKQSYKKDPKESIQKFRESYKNFEPEMGIYADNRLDSSDLSKLKLPSQAKLLSFGIIEHMKKATPYSNDLLIHRGLPSSDTVHFWSRTSIDSPILLPLQEYFCKEMGIKFK